MSEESRDRREGKGQQLYQRARKLIPGATGLLGKRAEMYLPEQWPAYYSKAKGVKIWDLDGNEFTDCTMCGIGTSTLGYCDPDVEAAVIQALKSGPMTTLNPPEEVELAELLLELHPWADMVKYARTGGEMMAMGIRIARAATGRDQIAFCGYHGWHDWYLAVNLAEGDDPLSEHLLPGLEPLGVPKGLAGTMHPFNYGDIEALEAILTERGSKIAAIVMEPCRSNGPPEGFLERVRELATEHGCALFFDEITSGWRVRTAGMHVEYGVEPDLCSFAKTISNGIPMAALIGRESIMTYAQRTFISSAYWTERLGPTAALATLRKHREVDAGARLVATGKRVQEGWRRASEATGLPIRVFGIEPLSTFAFEHEKPQLLLTLHIQNMLDRGFLASHQFYSTLAHTEEVVSSYMAAYEESLSVIAEAVESDTVEQRLRGPIKHSGFKRLT